MSKKLQSIVLLLHLFHLNVRQNVLILLKTAREIAVDFAGNEPLHRSSDELLPLLTLTKQIPPVWPQAIGQVLPAPFSV